MSDSSSTRAHPNPPPGQRRCSSSSLRPWPCPTPEASPTNAAGAPTVTGVEVTSDAGNDDTYALGETIAITVTFSEEVDRHRHAADQDRHGSRRLGHEGRGLRERKRHRPP